MTANVARLVFGQDGTLQMIVLPDTYKQLDDPAYSPAGSTTVDVARGSFTTATSRREILVQARDALGSGFPALTGKLAAQIQAIDDAAAAEAADQAATAAAIAALSDEQRAALGL
jgi:hypothetical protein